MIHVLRTAQLGRVARTLDIVLCRLLLTLFNKKATLQNSSLYQPACKPLFGRERHALFYLRLNSSPSPRC